MTTQLSVSNLSIITHANQPVITTELLAQLYGTETNNIKVNHSRNTDRFVEGKHYFKLEGSDLRELKHKVTQSNSVKIARNVKALILWTERGAARHAKMLETDQAWEVFEKLEDCYFNSKTVKQEDLYVNTSSPISVIIPKEGRWLVMYRNGKHQLICVDGHNVVDADYVHKLQRDGNLLVGLIQEFRMRTQVLQGDKSGDILNVPLIK